MRNFYVYCKRCDAKDAEGVIFGDGSIALRWLRSKMFGNCTVSYESLDELCSVNAGVSSGESRLIFP